MTGEEIDECLRALSHVERRQFYLACRAAPVAAGDLAGLSDLALASVSEHLKVLRKSQLVDVEKAGRFWMYRANPSRLAEVLAVLNDLEDQNGT